MFVSAVPVLPATWTPGIAAAVPVPPWTTATIIWVRVAAVSGLIALPRVPGLVFLTVAPPWVVIFWTTYGLGTIPPFAPVDATMAIWSGVASIVHWPKARRPGSAW